jgi:chromosome segregation ATPase
MTNYEHLRELCEKATPGPWEWQPATSHCDDCVVAKTGFIIEGNIFNADNARYIEKVSPDVVREMLDRIESAEAQANSSASERDTLWKQLAESKANHKEAVRLLGEALQEATDAYIELEAHKAANAQALGALEQLIDDMQEGHCVCEAAKQQAIEAIKTLEALK